MESLSGVGFVCDESGVSEMKDNSPNRLIKVDPDNSKSIMHRRSFFIVFSSQADFLFFINIGIT